MPGRAALFLRLFHLSLAREKNNPAIQRPANTRKAVCIIARMSDAGDASRLLLPRYREVMTLTIAIPEDCPKVLMVAMIELATT